VFFNHSIHVKKGIGCVSCHGRVDEMPFTYQAQSLLMEWCLDCHRDPARSVRPPEQVFNMTWKPSDEIDPESHQHFDQATLGPQLIREHQVKSLTSCSTCHR
jgi:hypothetical protein